jgi:hypothetical protein
MQAAAASASRAPGPALRWCCSARPPRTPATGSGHATGGQTAARVRIVVAGAIGVEGHAHHQRVGLPVFAMLFSTNGPAGIALGLEWCRAAGACGCRRLPEATPVRLRPKSKARKVCRWGGRRPWRLRPSQACPASGDSIQASKPKQLERAVVALLHRRVENDGQMSAPTVSQLFSASSDSSWPSPQAE